MPSAGNYIWIFGAKRGLMLLRREAVNEQTVAHFALADA
jgi:hypothetical protein